jgi:23S rRNA (guanosine2251-2'-O)-methyltransferase
MMQNCPFALFFFVPFMRVFRYKRHEAHRAEWIRHQDDVAKMTNSSSSTSAPQRFPLVLILDNLRSANNVGSLFRTADAAGCRMVIAIGITAHPNGHGAEKLQKTAMGAQWTVPCTHFASLKAALEYVRTEWPQYQILGVETTAKSVDYRDFAFAEAHAAAGVALVLGNEVTGVDATIVPTLDGIVEIPMFGAKNSLNVAVCAPIILYEIHRQWKSSSSSSSISSIATTKELSQEEP